MRRSEPMINCGIVSAYGSIPGSPIQSKCSLRLAVRTPPSHGGNRGSIPLGSTTDPSFPYRFRSLSVRLSKLSDRLDILSAFPTPEFLIVATARGHLRRLQPAIPLEPLFEFAGPPHGRVMPDHAHSKWTRLFGQALPFPLFHPSAAGFNLP